MSKVESGVFGEAEVIFGGKVGASLGKADDVNVPHIVVMFEELNKNMEIGIDTSKEDCHKTPQVFMLFDNIESIEVVQKILELGKQELINKLNKV